MPIYLANDSYEGFLQTTYNPGESVLALDNLPLNVPTIVVSAPGTEYEAVFTVTGKTINALTGVTRIRGYNGVLVEGTAITCLNNEEFINQYRTYLGIDWKGDWADDVAYAIQDGVAYNNTSYVAIQAGTNHLPTDTAYWQVVGVQGGKGDTGSAGADGLGVPAGGATGEVLKKKSNDDNDTEWSSISSFFIVGETPNGTVNGSNVNFTTTNSYASGTLAIYQNLGRLTSGVDFTPVSGGFTMTTAPVTGDILRVDYIKT